MMERYTPQTQEAFGLVLSVAETLNHGRVGAEHLLTGLLQEGTGVAVRVLEENGVEEGHVIELMSQLTAPNPTVQTTDRTAYTPKVRRVIENSYREAVRLKAAQIEAEHILIAMLREEGYVANRPLNTIGVNAQKLYINLLAAMGENAPTAKDDLQGVRAGEHGNATPTLDSYSRNLTQLVIAEKLGPAIRREQEIQRVIQILSRRTKNNPCLTGEPGVGKTAVIEDLAQMIAPGDVPETIADKRVVTLDLSGMMTGSKYRDEFEERAKKVISEVVKSDDVLLFIDEIYTTIGTSGAEGALDASNTLKSSLTRDEVQLIGATTVNEYRKYVEKDSALERRFQPVTVDEPTERESVAILKGLRSRYEERHKVEIMDNALKAAVKLSSRYADDRFLSDKAIDPTGEAASGVHLQSYTKSGKVKVYEAEIDGLEEAKEEAIRKGVYERAGEIKKKQEKLREKTTRTMKKWQKDKEGRKLIVSGDEIADVVSGWTRVPARELAEEESERLRDLEGILHQRVVDQEEVVTTISKVIRRDRVGFKNPKYPTGSFLFLGPMGVGKAGLSKTLPEAMLGVENVLVRVNMSEYMGKYSASKMMGPPPGYVGYDERGQLSEKVRRSPYSIILLDEAGKVHPGVFNILLQVLDDGHIIDTQGREIGFKGTIITMTPNAGAESIIPPKRLGFGMVSDAKADYTFMKDRVMDEVKRLFKPGFLDRINEIVVFHQLTGGHIKEIADIMLGTVSKRCKEQLGIGLEAMDSARRHLIDKGYDDRYGVGPLRYTIQNLVGDRMAEEMLDGSIKAGLLVEVGFDGEKLTLTVRARTARPKVASKPAAAREGLGDKGETVRGKSSAGRATGRKKETRASKA